MLSESKLMLTRGRSEQHFFTGLSEHVNDDAANHKSPARFDTHRECLRESNCQNQTKTDSPPSLMSIELPMHERYVERAAIDNIQMNMQEPVLKTLETRYIPMELPLEHKIELSNRFKLTPFDLHMWFINKRWIYNDKAVHRPDSGRNFSVAETHNNFDPGQASWRHSGAPNEFSHVRSLPHEYSDGAFSPQITIPGNNYYYNTVPGIHNFNNTLLLQHNPYTVQNSVTTTPAFGYHYRQHSQSGSYAAQASGGAEYDLHAAQNFSSTFLHHNSL